MIINKQILLDLNVFFEFKLYWLINMNNNTIGKKCLLVYHNINIKFLGHVIFKI